MKSGPGAKVRCAIYTRVSTDQGLDQDFNSLDAQYEACSAYIKSQAHGCTRQWFAKERPIAGEASPPFRLQEQPWQEHSGGPLHGPHNRSQERRTR